MPEMFILPFRPAFDGLRVVPGAQAWFTVTGTDTPATVYTTSVFSAARTNPVVADGIGMFPTTYLDSAISYRVRVYARDAEIGVDDPLEEYDPYIPGTGLKGDPGSPGEGYPTRTAMAAAVATSLDDAYLTEAGREGKFVFSTANLSALVTADTAQGIYVAPSSDTNGSSGAWVRIYTGPLSITWFGGKADGAVHPTSGGYLGTLGATNNSVALNAALAFAEFNAASSGADKIYAALPEIHFPAANGVYDFQSTVHGRRSVRLTGDGIGSAGGVSASILRWPPGMHGLIFHYYASDLAGAVAPTQYGAGGTIIDGLSIFQHATGNALIADNYHGVWAKCPVVMRNGGCSGWSGNGFQARASVGGGGDLLGNANLFRVANCAFYGNENGMFIDGGDVNAAKVDACDASNNRAYGFNDSSFLGNTYIGCHADSNGTALSNGNAGRTSVVSHGGNRYGVKVGQVAGAATNAPTGAATDNTWWKYIGAGGASGGFPAWANGMSLVEGGAYRSDDVSARNLFLGCYAESGQGLSYINQATIALGGLHANGIESQSGVVVNNNLGRFEVLAPIHNANIDGLFNDGPFTMNTGGVGYNGAVTTTCRMFYSATAGLVIQPGSSGAQFSVWTGSAATALTVEGGTDNGDVKVWQNFRCGTATTASAANLFQSATLDVLLRSTSSKKYKRDIEKLDPAYADALLALQPVWYRSTSAADPSDWSYYGLVAEEVAKVDPRLVHYSYQEDQYEDYEIDPATTVEDWARDEDSGEPLIDEQSGRLFKVSIAVPARHGQRVKEGEQPRPDGVQYERLTVLLLDIIKRQEKRLGALERRARP